MFAYKLVLVFNYNFTSINCFAVKSFFIVVVMMSNQRSCPKCTILELRVQENIPPNKLYPVENGFVLFCG